jgi:KUP system potassium uptake protein
MEPLGHDCWQIILFFGFMDQLDVSHALSELCEQQGLKFDMMHTSFFVSRQTVIPVVRKRSGMAFWREHLFAAMARNAGSVVEYLNIPHNRVCELGTEVEI